NRYRPPRHDSSANACNVTEARYRWAPTLPGHPVDNLWTYSTARRPSRTVLAGLDRADVESGRHRLGFGTVAYLGPDAFSPEGVGHLLDRRAGERYTVPLPLSPLAHSTCHGS